LNSRRSWYCISINEEYSTTWEELAVIIYHFSQKNHSLSTFVLLAFSLLGCSLSRSRSNKIGPDLFKFHSRSRIEQNH